MNEIRKLMEAIEKINEEVGGPFNNKKDAQADARSEIGGGKEGTNFKTYKKNDGWYWTEQVNEEIKHASHGCRPFIDLSGPDGNAFVVMARAKQYAKQLELDGDAIVAEMQKGDYENLLSVFDKYFGEYVDLYRGNSEESIDEEFGDDPDPYSAERSVRQATNKLHELMDEQILDPRAVADAALKYMSEDDVADMAHINDLIYDDDDVEESIEVVGEAYDEEVSGEVRFRDPAAMTKAMLRDMQKLERNTSRVYREATQSKNRIDFANMVLNELGETLTEITNLVEKYEDAYVSTPGKYNDK